jgi:hypothetical protein
MNKSFKGSIFQDAINGGNIDKHIPPSTYIYDLDVYMYWIIQHSD